MCVEELLRRVAVRIRLYERKGAESEKFRLIVTVLLFSSPAATTDTGSVDVCGDAPGAGINTDGVKCRCLCTGVKSGVVML